MDVRERREPVMPTYGSSTPEPPQFLRRGGAEPAAEPRLRRGVEQEAPQPSVRSVPHSEAEQIAQHLEEQAPAPQRGAQEQPQAQQLTQAQLNALHAALGVAPPKQPGFFGSWLRDGAKIAAVTVGASVITGAVGYALGEGAYISQIPAFMGISAALVSNPAKALFDRVFTRPAQKRAEAQAAAELKAGREAAEAQGFHGPDADHGAQVAPEGEAPRAERVRPEAAAPITLTEEGPARNVRPRVIED